MPYWRTGWDRAIEAVENARELLIGSFDMFTTQTTLRASEVMKVLTLVSFIWFPASVIVSITAMIIPVPVYPHPSPGFWVMIAVLVSIAFLDAGFRPLAALDIAASYCPAFLWNR